MENLWETAPYQKHSQTSRQAAIEIENKLTDLQCLVLDTLGRYGPQTDLELEACLGISGSTLRPRRIELLRKGLISENGKRKTQSGRMAVVWRAK